MSEDAFEPRLGRMRSAGSSRGRKYLHAVLASAARAGFRPPRRGRGFQGRGARGGTMARLLALQSGSSARTRRAIVKTRLVRLGGNKALGGSRAHLRYLQRDAVSVDGEPGGLYSATDDRADGSSFLERGVSDRHQFRLIVSLEDGAQYDDLKPLIRRFMARMEEDLGTRLDWVAADHVDTLHPHTHVMLRGKDDKGDNLVIAPAYIGHGMRQRLAELVTLDLGPVTELEHATRLRREVGAERLTSLDRQLLRDMKRDRSLTIEPSGRMHVALRAGRLRKLGALGLAQNLGGGRWRLSEDLEHVLRDLGERGDIIRTMQRALKAARLDRATAEQAIYRPGEPLAIVGRLVSRGLADEARDRHYLIVDGTDGLTHYIDIGRGDRTSSLPDRAVVRIAGRHAAARDSDRRIAEVAAAHDGRYSVSLHRAFDPAVGRRFAEAHVRRLEAIRRRVGEVERLADGSWRIPPNYERVAERYERQQARLAPADVSLVSPIPLEQLVACDGATWLDHELASPSATPRDQGFGREVRSALALRRAWLLDNGLASEEGGQLRHRAGMLAALQKRELSRVTADIAEATGLEPLDVEAGASVQGIVRRRLNLASGQFAVIENGRQFALVPWRPVLERAIGREVSGRGTGGAISWAIGGRKGPER